MLSKRSQERSRKRSRNRLRSKGQAVPDSALVRSAAFATSSSGSGSGAVLAGASTTHSTLRRQSSSSKRRRTSSASASSTVGTSSCEIASGSVSQQPRSKSRLGCRQELKAIVSSEFYAFALSRHGKDEERRAEEL